MVPTAQDAAQHKSVNEWRGMSMYLQARPDQEHMVGAPLGRPFPCICWLKSPTGKWPWQFNQVSNGMQDVCKEVIFHFKMSVVGGEKYIRVKSSFLGSLLLISHTSICWIPRGTKMDVASVTPQTLGSCWWSAGWGWSFISEAHWGSFIYTKTLFIAFVVFLDYVSALETFPRNTIMAICICTHLVLTELKFKFDCWSQFVSFSLLRLGGHMLAVLFLFGLKNLDISFWFINSILKEVFSKAKALVPLEGKSVFRINYFRLLCCRWENILERCFAVLKRVGAN